MKGHWFGVFVVIVVGLLSFGGVVTAETFVWDGSESDSWVNPNNWVGGNGYPNSNDDVVTISDASINATCRFDASVPTTVASLTVGDTSPNRMRFYLPSGSPAFNVGTLTLRDYAELDLNESLIMDIDTNTYWSGSIWIDVDGPIPGIDDGEVLHMSDVSVSDRDVTLYLSGAGQVKVANVDVDAAAPGTFSKSLTVNTGTLVISQVHSVFEVRSRTTVDNIRAKLRIAPGAKILVDTMESLECDTNLSVEGGTTYARRAELDLDGDLNIQGASVTGFSGLVYIDADNATLNGAELTVYGKLVVNGSNGGKVISSQNPCSFGCCDGACEPCN